MTDSESLESRLKKARLHGAAYESHQVSATRVAMHGLGSKIRMPWEISDNFLGLPSLPPPLARGGCLISTSVLSQ